MGSTLAEAGRPFDGAGRSAHKPAPTGKWCITWILAVNGYDSRLSSRGAQAMADETAEELEAIIRRLTLSRRAIEPTTRLWHDLRISGDDASELLEDIHRQFGTNFFDFEFEPYFPDESEGMFAPWTEWLHRGRWKPFTFGHLVQVVKAGKWFEPDSAEGHSAQ
jgi:hypothetical protein